MFSLLPFSTRGNIFLKNKNDLIFSCLQRTQRDSCLGIFIQFTDQVNTLCFNTQQCNITFCLMEYNLLSECHATLTAASHFSLPCFLRVCLFYSGPLIRLQTLLHLLCLSDFQHQHLKLHSVRFFFLNS